MPAPERSISLRGPRFYRAQGRLMFVRHIDPSTREGPREATAGDIDAWPDAFEAFEAEDEGGPLGPLVSFRDPQGGAPAPGPGPHARRRARAAEATPETAG